MFSQFKKKKKEGWNNVSGCTNNRNISVESIVEAALLRPWERNGSKRQLARVLARLMKSRKNVRRRSRHAGMMAEGNPNGSEFGEPVNFHRRKRERERSKARPGVVRGNEWKWLLLNSLGLANEKPSPSAPVINRENIQGSRCVSRVVVSPSLYRWLFSSVLSLSFSSAKL